MSSTRPRVFVVVPQLQPHDAVGNDVLGMEACFAAAGFQTTILAQWIRPGLEGRARLVDREDPSIWSRPEDILIYHHAIQWELGEKLLASTRTRVVIKHHNVTPAAFYEPYSDEAARSCQEGMEATRRMARLRSAWYWGDSAFNAGELMREGAPPERCRVVPPCHRIETELACARLDTQVLGRSRRDARILSVGALRPHKGQRKALEVFARYRELAQENSTLVLVGSSDPRLKTYEEELRERAVALQVAQNVEIVSNATPGQLRAHYLAANVFLCVSEHEGFCVPLAESMYFRLPIVAWGITAVKETCGDAAFVTDRYDPEWLAQRIDGCVEDPALGRDLACRARSRYENEFRPDAIERRLLDLLEEVIERS